MEEEGLSTIRREWWQHPAIGWTLFTLGVVERLIGWGGSIDFILARTGDPGWVGSVLRFIASYSEYLGLLMIVGGFLLILWNERRRHDQTLASEIAALRRAVPSLVPSEPAPRFPPQVQLPDGTETRLRLGVAAAKVLIAQERAQAIDAILKNAEIALAAEPPPAGTPRHAMTMGGNPMRGAEPLRKCAFDLGFSVEELDGTVREYVEALSHDPRNFRLIDGDEKHYWTDADQKIQWLKYKATLKAHYNFLKSKRTGLWQELSALKLMKDLAVPPL